MSATFFCPFCGKQSPDDEQVCSRCGKSLDRWREYPFEERLLLTLRHPLREHRMMAIQILGERKYEQAVPVFAELIAAGQDVYTLREIARALMSMDTPECRQLLARLREHSSPVVRTACEPESRFPPGASR